jgi:8-oxo-dGTP pyrophosphatase MutT (NUDIX family)
VARAGVSLDAQDAASGERLTFSNRPALLHRQQSATTEAYLQRTIRYQGAVIRDHHVLLIQQRHYATGHCYWLLPGGGREREETAEACVQREVHEETHLHVRILRQVLDDPDMPGGTYERQHTYLCHVIDGEAQPGYEPEDETAEEYAITAVRWLDLREPALWDAQVRTEPWTYPLLQRLRAALGYRRAEGEDADQAVREQ